MEPKFYTNLSEVMEEMHFGTVFMPEDPRKVKIFSKSINRLGLQLIGSLKGFDNTRILTMGESESYFLDTLNSKEIYDSIDAVLSLKPPVLIIAAGIRPLPEILRVARKHKIPILTSNEQTADLISALTPILDILLAPRITRSGELLNVHGEGVLLIGESGIGKSETTIELLKKGHRLISDDLVEIKRTKKDSLMGYAPENTRHFIEVRGIGIINARRMFGIGAIKLSETIDIVINLEVWKDNKEYDRLGVETLYTEILGVRIPYVEIPVRPGRNLSTLIEIAAMNNRQKKLGFNAAQELFKSLGMNYPKTENPKIVKCIWDI